MNLKRRTFFSTISSAILMMYGCGGSENANVGWSWGFRGKRPGRFGSPRGIIARNGVVYVIDRTGRIQKFNTKGEYILGWTLKEFDNGTPTDLTIDTKGDVWVADTHYSRILHFSPKGDYLSSFGEYGEDEGRFVFPTDLTIGPQGNFYITEYGKKDRIQVFSPEGKYLRSWGEYGAGDGQLNRSMGIVCGPDELLYVADAVNNRVSVFRLSGEFVKTFGGEGQAKGKMKYPYDIDVDEDNFVYVCEYGNHRAQKFTPDGQSLGTWGTLGSGEGELFNPWGISVCDDNIYVADRGNHRIQVYPKKM